MKKYLLFTFLFVFSTVSQAYASRVTELSTEARIKRLHDQIMAKGQFAVIDFWGERRVNVTHEFTGINGVFYKPQKPFILPVQRPTGTPSEQLFKVFSQAVILENHYKKAGCYAHIIIDWNEENPCRVDGDHVVRHNFENPYYTVTEDLRPYADKGGTDVIHVPLTCEMYDDTSTGYESNSRDYFLLMYKFCRDSK